MGGGYGIRCGRGKGAALWGGEAVNCVCDRHSRIAAPIFRVHMAPSIKSCRYQKFPTDS